MFLVNSRLGRFSAAFNSSNSKYCHRRRRSFSRSYGTILPSSLTRVLSRALGFSPCLPVSVCGTVTRRLPRGFSWQLGISLLLAKAFASPLGVNGSIHLKRTLLQGWAGELTPPRPSLLRHPIGSLSSQGGLGILTLCPSSTPVGLDLGTD